MKNFFIFILFLILFLAVGGLIAWNVRQNQVFTAETATLQQEVAAIASSTRSNTSAISAQEFANRQTVIAKSQNQQVTAAVAKALPAVVSIIISQNAPQYQVVCENPFGNDPFFQGQNICIPTYQQTGTSLQEVGAGSGFIFTHDGYIVTNKHVIFDPSAQYTVVLSNGKKENATVIYRDPNPNTDIAIIKIPGTFATTASIGDSSSLQLGQTVAAIGNALGQYSNSVSLGIISGLNRSIQAQDESGNVETLPNVIQTDAAINPGNSGGPLIDLSGNVIGINVATVQGGNNIGFSIPINLVRPILQNYK